MCMEGHVSETCRTTSSLEYVVQHVAQHVAQHIPMCMAGLTVGLIFHCNDFLPVSSLVAQLPSHINLDLREQQLYIAKKGNEVEKCSALTICSTIFMA